MLSMIDSAVAGSAPFLPVRLVVFPEFAQAAPVFETAAELIEKLAVTIPNEHTERLEMKARAHGIYIKLARCSKWIRDGQGASSIRLASSARKAALQIPKVNTWIPYEVHTSPHDLEGYDEPLFPGG
jgi:hypothetical protein